MATAYIRTTYNKGFLLTEEALVKLDDIIRKRLASAIVDTEIRYSVYREDGVRLEFDKPLEVASEENSLRNAVKRIDISSKSEACQLSLTFDRSEKTSLIINSDSRDLGYLLYSDIKEYLLAEVLKLRSFDPETGFFTKVITPSLALIVPMAVVAFMTPQLDQGSIDHALRSADVAEKLDFLINEAVKRQSLSVMKYFPAFAALVFIPMFFLGPAINWLYPRNIFAWGKVGDGFQRRVDLRGKLFWGVVIATIVSIASALFLDFAKKHS